MVSPRLFFPRQARLTKTDEFSSVFAFRRAYRSPHLMLHWGERRDGENAEQARLGLVVGKRYAPTAVRRNLVKRLARETFRRVRETLPCRNYIVRLASRIEMVDRRDLRQEIEGLFAKLAQEKSSMPQPEIPRSKPA